MKTSFNDGELKRLLKEFAAVNHTAITSAKSTAGAIRKQNSTVNKYARLINGWVHSKIETNYRAKIVKTSSV